MLEWGVKSVGKGWMGVGSVPLIGLLAVTVNQPWNRVVEVIDGDTFRMANGQKVRLLGIDAPELTLCGGQEAKKELEKLSLGRKVELAEIKADNYGRILALARAGKQIVNTKMIETGWARWDGTENGLKGQMSQAGNLARAKEAGIWGKCRKNDNPECLIKGNIEKRSGTTGGGKKSYFFPGCSEYEATVVEKELGENWFCSEAEARAAGYTKGVNCFKKSWDPEN